MNERISSDRAPSVYLLRQIKFIRCQIRRDRRKSIAAIVGRRSVKSVKSVVFHFLPLRHFFRSPRSCTAAATIFLQWWRRAASERGEKQMTAGGGVLMEENGKPLISLISPISRV
jgi:hypothetical protein